MKRSVIILLALLNIAVTAVLAQNPKPSPYHYRRASLFEVLPITKNDIVFLGNSITDGGEWHEIFNNKNIKNRGISADKTFDVLDRLDPIINGQPKKVFLLIGINDIGNGYSVEATFENIVKIADRFIKDSPRTRLYIQSVLPVSDKNVKSDRHQSKTNEVKELNNMLKEFCAEKGLTYLDVFTALADENGKLKDEFTNDGLHLMGAGYLEWAKVIKSQVN